MASLFHEFDGAGDGVLKKEDLPTIVSRLCDLHGVPMESISEAKLTGMLDSVGSAETQTIEIERFGRSEGRLEYVLLAKPSTRELLSTVLEKAP